MMRTLLLAGTSLLALSASVASAAAAPIFSDTTPGLTSTTLAPGTYDIVATGAGGGNGRNRAAGGPGAVVEGTFSLTATETLSILVGGLGGSRISIAGGPGGGGGSFVVGPGGTPLVIAGGGGGGSSANNGGSGGTIADSGGAGGTGGGASFSFGSGGGGGLTGNGSAGGNGGSGLGGIGGTGTGGTSFDAGTNPLFSLAATLGDGSVVITDLTPPPPSVPEPASLALLGTGLAGLLALRRRRR